MYSKWLDDENPTPEDPDAVRSRLVATQVNTYNREDVTQATLPIKVSRMVVSQAATRTNAKGHHDCLIARHDISVAVFPRQGFGQGCCYSSEGGRATRHWLAGSQGHVRHSRCRRVLGK